MADKNTNINIKVIIDAAESAKTVQQTRQALKDLKSAALQVEEGSDAFVALTRAAGELQDKMGDLSNQTKFFADDMRNLSGLSAIGSGIAGGFNVLQGTMALVAGESEDMQKAMQKVQITMGIVQGLQEVSVLLNKNETAAIFAKSVATKTAAVAQLIYATAVGTSTGALKAFRIALLATGIGAVVVAIGLLVANWDKLTEAIGLSTKSLKDYNEEQKHQAELDQQVSQQRISNWEKESAARENADQKADNLQRTYIENDLLRLENEKKMGAVSELEYEKKKARLENELQFQTEIWQEYDRLNSENSKTLREQLKRESELSNIQREQRSLEIDLQIAKDEGDKKEQRRLERELEAKKEIIKQTEETNADLLKSDDRLVKANVVLKEELDRKKIILEKKLAAELKKIDEDAKKEQKTKDEEQQKKAIELASKTKEERKKILDEELKDIELFMQKLKLSEQATFQKFGIPQEILDENINKMKDNAEQQFKAASVFDKSRFKLNMDLIGQETKMRSDFRQQQIGEEIRYATMEYEKKKEAIKNTIADSEQRNQLLTSLEEQHQLNIQTINTVGQNDIVKLEKDGGAKKLAEIRRNQEEEKQIRQQALDVMVQSANEAYDAIAAKVQDTYKQMIDMSNAEYAVRQKNIDNEIEDFRNQGKQISIEEQARLDKEAEFQAKKDALEQERAAKEKQLKTEAFEKQRQMDMLAILANTAVAITKQLAATPLPLGAPLIAAIAAQGVIQTAIVASQQPAFAEGGLVSGPGGPKDDKISVRLSNGESVINARSTKMYAPLLSQINQAGGGRAIPRLAAGGIVTNVPSSGMDTSRLEEIMLAMANRPIETYVKEASVTRAQARTVREKKRTSF